MKRGSERELRKQWEEELLSDEALDAAARTGLLDGDYDRITDAERAGERREWREGFEAALASINQKGGE